MDCDLANSDPGPTSPHEPRVVGVSRKPSAVSVSEEMSLHEAVEKRDVSKVRELLAAGADPNQPDWQRNAEIPLLEAAKTGDVDLVKVMIDAGCDPNVRNWQGETALHVVTCRRRPDPALLTVLLEAGADGSIADKLSGWTPLHHLLKHFSPAKSRTDSDNLRCCVDALLKSTDVNKSTKGRTTALHLVASSGLDEDEPLTSLLSAGACPNVHDDKEASPLMMATEKDCPNIVRLLLLHGALPSDTNRYKETPLHVAARRNLPAVADALLRSDIGDAVNAKDLDGNTPLHLAAARGYHDMVMLLLTHPNLDVNSVNENGYTALHLASGGGFHNVVSLLVEVKECDVRRLTKRRLSAMDLARGSNRSYSIPAVCEVLHKAMESSGSASPGNESFEEQVVPSVLLPALDDKPGNGTDSENTSTTSF